MIGYLEKVWLVLISLTLLGALIGETGQSSWILALTVVSLISLKGTLVIDHYMDMRNANHRIRNVLRFFILLVVILVVISHGFGDEVRQFTTLDD